MSQEGLTADELLIAGVAGALVVLCGGLYALFLALSEMRRRRGYRFIAYSNYLFLCLAFFTLARALHLDFFWCSVIGLLLTAYLVAPHFVWKLTQATHEIEK